MLPTAEAAFGGGADGVESAGRVDGGSGLVPIVQHFLPVEIFGQDRLTRPHSVLLGVVDAGRRDASLVQRSGGLEHAASNTDNHRIGGAQVFSGAVHDRAHAGDDRVVL